MMGINQITSYFLSNNNIYFEQIKKYMNIRLKKVLHNINFPILTTNSMLMENIAENISYVILQVMIYDIENDYYTNFIKNPYTCIEQSIDIIFFNKRMIENIDNIALKESMFLLSYKDNNMLDEIDSVTNSYKYISLNIIQSFDKISDDKLQEIIINVYKKYIIDNKQNTYSIFTRHNKYSDYNTW